MIPNLTESVIFSEESQDTIEHLEPLIQLYWSGSSGDIRATGKRYGIGAQRDRLKREIKAHLVAHQGYICCYCGLKLKRTSPAEIEHIAPQAHHPEFLFTPLNLAFICSLCNGFTKKSGHDSISVKDADYASCVFNIVHPYLHDISDHYEFVDTEGYLCIIIPLTPEARQSDEIFKLSSLEMTEERYKESLLNANPLPNNIEDIINTAMNIERSI